MEYLIPDYATDCFHSESENRKFQMYRFDAEDPGQSLYTPTTIGVICNARNIDLRVI